MAPSLARFWATTASRGAWSSCRRPSRGTCSPWCPCPGLTSDRREPNMRLGGQLDLDRVAGPHLAALEHDAHHAGLAVRARRRRRGRARPSSAPARSRRAGSRGCAGPSPRRRPRRRAAGACPPAAPAARRRSWSRSRPSRPAATSKPCAASSSCSSAWIRWTWRRFGCVGVLPHARAVLDRRAGVDVALDAQAGDQPDRVLVVLADPVARPAADGFDPHFLRLRIP